MDEMTEEIYIEPTEKVLKALKTAIETLGRDEYLKRLKIKEEELEKWINGEEWIPMKILYETCRINLRHNKPYNTLSEVIEKATVISRRGGLEEKESIKVKEEVKEVKEKVVDERIEDEGKRLFRFMISRSIALLSLMIPLILMGYTIGSRISEFYAGIGVVIGVVIWLLIITTYIILKPIKYK
ncbi:MAG: hypothetical protein QXO82_04180 [Candidatus Methanomethylicia archaeon]